MTLHVSRDTNDTSRRYHLVGIGGVGMSSLAQLLLALGHTVSGSDRYHDQGKTLNILTKLQLSGVKLAAQDGSAVRDGLDAVVVSTAIEENNPEISAARTKKIKVIHRAELLARLAGDKKCIAVTGSAGKTTVTGMIGWTLEQLGHDPTVVNGGAVLNWINDKNPGNFRFGRSHTWVIELDESDRSLFNFSPDWAVITNVSQDHFELDEVKNIFLLFSKQVKRNIIGLNLQNWTGINVDDFCPRVFERGISFQYRGIDFSLPLLGRHNIENALHCVMLCDRLGMNLNETSRALAGFAGIERRLQIVGKTDRVAVIDDYAHNPAKIEAAWQTVGSFAKRIVAVWRPHGYRPLALMYQDLVGVFSRCIRAEDSLVVMSVYFAGGTAKKEVTARMLADDLRRRGLPVDYAENYEELRSALREKFQPGGAVLFMGARDPDMPVFAKGYKDEQK